MCNCMSNNDLNDSSVLGRRPALESKPDGRVLEQLFNGHHCSICHSNWFDGLSSSSIHTDAASLLPIRFRRNGQLRNSTNACKCFTTESERMYFIEVFRLAQFRSCMARKSELEIVFVNPSAVVFDTDEIESTAFNLNMNGR